MRRFGQTAAAIAALVILVAFIGYVGRPQPVDARPAEPLPPNPEAMKPFAVGEPRHPAGPVAARDVFPLRSHQAAYVVTDNRSPGGVSEMTLLASADDKARWRFDRLGQRVERLRLEGNGSIVMIGMENLEHDVVIELEKPICVLPARLVPGQRLRGASKMKVLDRNNPRHVRDSGKIAMTVWYDADQTLHTPAGDFECRRVWIECDASFTLGNTRSTSAYYYADGVGLVAEIYDSRTAILLFPQERHIRAVLADAPQPMISRGGSAD